MRGCVAILICAFLAGPASAEFYRWKDAAGREHFAQEIHQVPAEHRAEAEASRQRGSDGVSVNFHATPEREATPGGRVGAEQGAPAAQAPPAWSCGALRREVKKKQKVIRKHQASVDSNLRWADDISKSAFSRRKYEARAEEEGRWLTKAETDLTRYREEQRRLGAPPGCLR